MSLANLGPLGLALGLAVLAGLLFALQRLRVRHREVPVVTTLFWREAVEEARARVLVQRFRHLLAYLLVLLIASLLWLALAEPRGTGRGPGDHIVLVDGSAAMGAPGRMDAARDALADEVAHLPRRATTVLWCGATPRTLLAPGESTLLLEKRLDELTPEAVPPGVEAALLALAEVREPGRALELIVVGDAPVGADALALLAADVSVRRATDAPATIDNAGIVALGVGPSSSGAWNEVDVLIELAGGGDPLATLGGAEVLRAPTSEVLADGRVRLRYADLPARGETFAVALTRPDDIAADDQAALVLPRRPLLRVAVSDSLADVFGPVLDADPAVVRDEADPDVVVRLGGEALFEGRPAIVLVPQADQEEAILLVHDAAEDSSDVLARALGELGLDRIDAAGLAEEAARPIAAGALPGPVPQVALWRELTDRTQFQFVESRAFPVLVARALRWLARVEPILPYAAACEPLVGVPALQELDSLGAPLAPPRTGSFTRRDGEPLRVSLLSASASVPALSAELSLGELGEGDGWDGVTWLLLLVLALLGLDSFLARTGRMP